MSLSDSIFQEDKARKPEKLFDSIPSAWILQIEIKRNAQALLSD
jgi:hypothetical protein